MNSRVSVAELIDSDVPLRPDEAVAIVRDVCRQYAEGDLHGIPNATVIRLTPDGTVVVEGPVSRDTSPVLAAAALLDELLPSFHSANGFRVPGGLRLVLARATGALDLPPFTSPDEFRAALERFAAPDLPEVVRRLFRSWAAREPEPADLPSRTLTISDVRRARRATGLSLEDVSRASGLPAATLRELEWGYVRNWRADAEGREDLRRYAHASGLDEALVISIAWPLISAESTIVQAPPEETTRALVPAQPQALVTIPRRQHVAQPARHPWAVAVAAAAVVIIAVLATGRDRPLAAVSAPPAIASPAAAPRLEPPAVSPPDVVPEGRVRPATYVRAVPVERHATPERPHARTRSRRQPPAPERPAPAKSRRSFLDRELFRIVIR